MTHKTLLRSAAALALLMAGCFSEKTTSSDPAADTFTIQGVAATGWAIAGAEVRIVDGEDEVLFTGTTDELGQYLASVVRASIDFPISISVTLEEQTWEALVAEPADMSILRELRAHVNPVTDMVAREIRIRHAQLADITPEEMDSIARNRVEALLGEGVRYESFAQRPEYVAAVRERPEIVPTTEDMILHSLEEMAAQRQQHLQTFLQEQEALGARLLTVDPEFQAQLAANMEQFRLQQTQIREDMDALLQERTQLQEQRQILEQQMDSLRAQYRELPPHPVCTDSATAELIEAAARRILTLRQTLANDPENAEVREMLAQATTTHQQMIERMAQNNCGIPQQELVVEPVPGTQQEAGSPREGTL